MVNFTVDGVSYAVPEGTKWNTDTLTSYNVFLMAVDMPPGVKNPLFILEESWAGGQYNTETYYLKINNKNVNLGDSIISGGEYKIKT